MQSYSTAQSPPLEGSTLAEATEEEEESHQCDTKATSIADSETKPRATSLSTAIPNPKSKTTFRLAHPPPVSTHRQHLHIRPRVLLQLQRVSKTVRPKPVLEVLPSVIFAPKLARRFPRTFKGKAGLGADDLVIVSCENYDTAEPDARDTDELFEDARWEEREIIAAICQPSKDKAGCQGKAEICFSDGAMWTASKLANGSYELISTDEHGLQSTARWVVKPPKQRTPSLQNRPRSPSMEEKKFNFSVLNPNSRRHAVISTLDRHSIEVSDQYCNPPAGPKATASSNTTTTLSTPTEDKENGQEVTSPISWHSESNPASTLDKTIRNSNCDSVRPAEINAAADNIIKMSEPLRTLIIISGLWVAFQEGFSPNFIQISPAHGQSAATNSSSRHQPRSVSLNVNQLGGENSPSLAKPTFGNVPRMRNSLRQTTSTDVVPLSQSSKPPNTPPRRSMSTSSTFMRRATSRRSSANRSNHSDSLGDYDGDETTRSSIEGRSVEWDASMRKLTLDNLATRKTGSGAPLSGRRTPSYQNTLEPPLEPVISNGLDPAAEALKSSKDAPKKPRRLEKLFGVRRRSRGGL